MKYLRPDRIVVAFKNHCLLFLLLFVSQICIAQILEVEGKAKVINMDTVINVDANVVRKSDGSLALRRYRIGDYVHEGIVFWIDESREHGLIVMDGDIDTGIWGSGSVTNATGGRISGPILQAGAAGAGFMNTVLIIGNAAGSAAQACAETSADFGDWYLPSIGELGLIYLNLVQGRDTPLGNFQEGNYWSSTEEGIDSAWAMDILDGNQFVIAGKDQTANIRPIRKF